MTIMKPDEETLQQYNVILTTHTLLQIVYLQILFVNVRTRPASEGATSLLIGDDNEGKVLE